MTERQGQTKKKVQQENEWQKDKHKRTEDRHSCNAGQGQRQTEGQKDGQMHTERQGQMHTERQRVRPTDQPFDRPLGSCSRLQTNRK